MSHILNSYSYKVRMYNVLRSMPWKTIAIKQRQQKYKQPYTSRFIFYGESGFL